MGDLEVRTTARLQYAEEGRDLPWRFFYQEDIVALSAQAARLEGEKAEMAAALSGLEDNPICIHCRNNLERAAAALSGEGKVWEQARLALTFCTQETIHLQFHLGYRDGPQEDCPACRDAFAALAAMKGE